MTAGGRPDHRGGESACKTCGFANPQGFHFCGQCGAPLAPTRPSGAIVADAAERRHLTVLFCDLADSTALAHRLDPEELRDVVRAYQQAAVEAVERFGGHVAQYLGDGVLAYFGFPEAHEDDARRAVHAGLGIVEGVRGLSGRLGGQRDLRLAVRVGIDTGHVVAGEVGAGQRREQLALGQAPNVAARLQSIASADAVLISDATHRLVHGSFACESLGPRTLKGVAAPIAVFRVLRATEHEALFDGGGGAVPMVGRDGELSLLAGCFERASGGEGQAVCVLGEPGIGKSRLIQGLRERLGDEPVWLVGRCSAYHQTSALRPFLQALARRVGFADDEPAEPRLEKLEAHLQSLDIAAAEAVPLLAPLLSLPVPPRYPAVHLGPQLLKARTQDVLLRALLAAGTRPVILALEDLHWADPSSLDLLGLLMQRLPRERVLVLLSARPEFTPPRVEGTQLLECRLHRLGRGDAEALVARVAGNRLSGEVRARLVEKSDGVPLFAEELTKTVLEGEGGAGGPGAISIPDTLQDSLVARLDRLGPARAVAQLASVLGREFPQDRLAAVCGLPATELGAALDRLVSAELLFRRGEPPSATYVFKHALVQDAAYQSLLKSVRQEHHRTVATVLDDRFPDVRREEPEFVAHHYGEAGLAAQAVDCWIEAGTRATGRGGIQEAITHYSRGIALLPGIPADADRDPRELTLQMGLGNACSFGKGYGAPEVEGAFMRARELCERAEDAPQLAAALHGLFTFLLVRADLDRALALTRQMTQRAERHGTALDRVEAFESTAHAHLFRGELDEAWTSSDEGLRLDRANAAAWRTGADRPPATPDLTRELHCRVALRAIAAVVRWHRGEPDQAQALMDDALALARAAALPYHVVYAGYTVAWLSAMRRDVPATAAHALDVVRLSREHGYFLVSLGLVMLGWAQALARGTVPASAPAGPPEQDPLVMLRQGLDIYGMPGARISQTLNLAQLAEATALSGRLDEARQVLDQAVAAAEATGERFWEPELHRLRGELALRRPPAADPLAREREADVHLQHAVALARQRGARALELRAALSLGRLLAARGDAPRARVAEILGRFTEGFTTPDLIEARAFIGGDRHAPRL